MALSSLIIVSSRISNYTANMALCVIIKEKSDIMQVVKSFGIHLEDPKLTVCKPKQIEIGQIV